MTAQLENIRYVTANFKKLQGLRLIPFGFYFLLEASTHADWIPNFDFRLEGAIYMWVVSGLILLYWLIIKYYERNFGTVEARPQPRVKTDRAFIYAVAFFAALALDIKLKLPVNLVLLVIAAMLLYEGLDGSRRYGYVLLGLVVALFSFWRLSFGRVDEVFLTVFTGVFGLGCILLGTYYHLVLVRAFRNISPQP